MKKKTIDLETFSLVDLAEFLATRGAQINFQRVPVLVFFEDMPFSISFYSSEIVVALFNPTGLNIWSREGFTRVEDIERFTIGELTQKIIEIMEKEIQEEDRILN